MAFGNKPKALEGMAGMGSNESLRFEAERIRIMETQRNLEGFYADRKKRRAEFDKISRYF